MDAEFGNFRLGKEMIGINAECAEWTLRQDHRVRIILGLRKEMNTNSDDFVF